MLRAIVEKELILPGETVLAAVSGGSDSVALLALLRALAGRLGFCVAAAHFDHHIRGEASAEDARFTARLCAAWNVPCYSGGADVPALSAEWKCSLEDAARRARYAFLDETATACGAAKIALAHQMEDQAETLLLHLTHGCGLDGLAGMRPRQGNRIRPLLAVGREELRAYLRAREIPWREDETNLEPCCARNILRLNVFPALKQLNPRAAEAFCRAAEHAATAADAARERAEEKLRGHFSKTPYGAFWLTKEPDADAARLFAAKAGAPVLSEKQTMRLTSLRPGEETDLAGGWRALRSRERLHLICRTAEYDKGSAPFSFAPCAEKEKTGDGVRWQTFDAEKLEGAVFRARREGDVFAPLNMQGEQKLKKTLQDAGIDRPFRSLLPVLAKGNRILWIVGLKPSRDAAVTPETKRAVTIRYTGILPWEIRESFS